LKLTDRSKALRGGESGPAITPGDPAKSLLISMTATQKMPPKKPLTNQEVETLRQWIASGAIWEGTIQRRETTDRAGSDWWALQPLRDVTVNPIHGAANPGNQLDPPFGGFAATDQCPGERADQP
jgi:hypothetical protein